MLTLRRATHPVVPPAWIRRTGRLDLGEVGSVVVGQT